MRSSSSSRARRLCSSAALACGSGWGLGVSGGGAGGPPSAHAEARRAPAAPRPPSSCAGAPHSAWDTGRRMGLIREEGGAERRRPAAAAAAAAAAQAAAARVRAGSRRARAWRSRAAAVLRERGALLPALGLLDVLPPAPLLAGPHRGRCADAIPAPQRARSPPATSCSRGPRSRAQLATRAPQCGRERSIGDQRHSRTGRGLVCKRRRALRAAPRSTIELSRQRYARPEGASR